jgi:hypothetical protein
MNGFGNIFSQTEVVDMLLEAVEYIVKEYLSILILVLHVCGIWEENITHVGLLARLHWQ